MSGGEDLHGTIPQGAAIPVTAEGALVHVETPLAEGRSVPGGDRPIAPSVQSSLPGETVRREGEAQFQRTSDPAATLPAPGSAEALGPLMVCQLCGLGFLPTAPGAPGALGWCAGCADWMRRPPASGPATPPFRLDLRSVYQLVEAMSAMLFALREIHQLISTGELVDQVGGRLTGAQKLAHVAIEKAEKAGIR